MRMPCAHWDSASPSSTRDSWPGASARPASPAWRSRGSRRGRRAGTRSDDSSGATLKVAVHRRSLQRGRGYPRGGHRAVPAAHRVGHRLPAAARARAPAPPGQELPHGARFHRQRPRRRSASISATARCWAGPRSRSASRWRKTSPSCLPAAPCAWTGWPGRSFWTTSGRSPARGVRWLEQELRALGPDAGLAEFLEKTGTELVELYTGRDRSFTTLRHRAFGGPRVGGRSGRGASARLAALLHIGRR